MAKYLNKETFLQSMGLVGDETKYGNRDREHQGRSYSTWMGYEIMGSVEDSIVEEDVVEVVRCKDCEYRHDSCFAGNGNTYCDYHHKYFPLDGFCNHGIPKRCELAEFVENCDDCDFCSYGERREGE